MSLRVAALLAVCMVACGGETGAPRVRLRARFGGLEREASGPLELTTDTGWTVTLTEARAAVGPVYLNTLRPLSARRPPGLFERLSLPRAWAHGQDHLSAGRYVAQVTHQRVVDVLDPRWIDVPDGDGVGEYVGTSELWLYHHPDLRGAAVRARGVARRGETEVPFAVALVLDASLATASTPLEDARRVRGIPAGFVLEEGSLLSVRVDPRGWFQGADFDALSEAPADADGARLATLRDNVGRAFAVHTRAARGAFAVTLSAAP